MAFTQNQLNNVLLQAGGAIATTVTLLSAVSFIPIDQVKNFIDALHEFNAAVLTGYAAVLKMWVIIGPAAILMLAKFGFRSETAKSLMARAFKIATTAGDGTAKEAKEEIMKTAASPELGTIGILNPTMAAANTPDNVVATKAELPKAA